MTLHTTTTTYGRTCAPTRAPAVERALDEALDHIGDLAERLWAVRRLHGPGRRGLLHGRVRCTGCGQDHPCPTVLAAAPAAR